MCTDKHEHTPYMLCHKVDTVCVQAGQQGCSSGVGMHAACDQDCLGPPLWRPQSIHMDRAPGLPPSPPPFPRAQSCLCPPPFGTCQLMAGVPSQETTSRPLFICVSSEGLIGLESFQAPTVNGSPHWRWTTFLIAHDACGHCANSTVAITLRGLSRAAFCACVNLVFLGAKRPEWVRVAEELLL